MPSKYLQYIRFKYLGRIKRSLRRDIHEPPDLNKKQIFSIALSLMPKHDTVDYPGVSRGEAEAQARELTAVIQQAFGITYRSAFFMNDGEFFDSSKVADVFYAGMPTGKDLAQVLLEIESEESGLSIVAKINADVENCSNLNQLMSELCQNTVLRRRILLEDKKEPIKCYALLDDPKKLPESYYVDQYAFGKIGFPVWHFKIYD